MRLIALLCWYDENPSWLATTVAGIGRFCDGIVAVDGAYRLYPQAKGRSNPRQAEAILQTAEAMGLDCTIHQPKEPWRGNEVEKRNHALKLAGTLDPDWVVVVDADYHLAHINPELVRLELQHTEFDVATYAIADRVDHEQFASSWAVPSRDIFRWKQLLTVGPTHNDYRTLRTVLRGEGEVEALNLTQHLVFHHRNSDRTQERKADARAYAAVRAE